MVLRSVTERSVVSHEDVGFEAVSSLGSSSSFLLKGSRSVGI
jgi:hypothetical protein